MINLQTLSILALISLSSAEFLAAKSDPAHIVDSSQSQPAILKAALNHGKNSLPLSWMLRPEINLMKPFEDLMTLREETTLSTVTLNCTSSQCVDLIRSIKVNMDLEDEADACDNFYVHACKGWHSSASLPKSVPHVHKTYSELKTRVDEKVKKLLDTGNCPNEGADPGNVWDATLDCYYAGCSLDDTKRGFDTLIQFLEKDASFLLEHIRDPEFIVQETKNKSEVELGQLLSERLSKLLYIPFLIDLKIDVEQQSPDDSHRLLLQDTITLPYYITMPTDNKWHHAGAAQAHKENYIKLLEMFSADLKIEKRDFSERVENVIQIDRDFQTTIDLGFRKTKGEMSFNEAQDMLKPSLDLKLMLRESWPLSTSIESWSNNATVLVENERFFQLVSKKLRAGGWRREAVYDKLLLTILQKFAHALSNSYRTQEEEYFKRTRYASLLKSLSRNCQERAADFGWILARRYVKSVPDHERRKAIGMSIFEELRTTFNEFIDKAPWADVTVKGKLKLKLQNMQPKIGYPATLMNTSDDFLENFYGEITKDSIAAVRNRLSAEIFKSKVSFDHTLRLLKLPETLESWIHFPQDTTAKYSLKRNEIFVPLTMLQEPFLHLWEECDGKLCHPDNVIRQIMTYGSLGNIMAREMISAFTGWGLYTDEKGKITNLHTCESYDAFKPLQECFEDQYTENYVPLKLFNDPTKSVGVPIVGNRKAEVAENDAAHYGAINLAYETLKRLNNAAFEMRELELDTEEGEQRTSIAAAKLFALASTQLHCELHSQANLKELLMYSSQSPGFIQILKSLIRSPLMTDAYNCAAGDYMNPSNLDVSKIISNNSGSMGNDRISNDIFDIMNMFSEPLTPSKSCKPVWG